MKKIKPPLCAYTFSEVIFVKAKKILSFVVCALIPLAVGGASAFLSRKGMADFPLLDQPPFTPPAWVFPAVWTALYLLMGVASWLAYTAAADGGTKKKALTRYGEQLIFNFFWPILFFNLEVYYAAFLWLIVLWVLILLTMLAFWKIRPAAGALMLPYIVWVTLAAYLNLGVAILN